MPARIAPQSVPLQEADAAVAFAKRWPASHAIAQMRAPDEKPCGEYLMLWEDRRFTLSGELDVVLLSARTGAAEARTLVAPRPSRLPECQQAVVVEFHQGWIEIRRVAFKIQRFPPEIRKMETQKAGFDRHMGLDDQCFVRLKLIDTTRINIRTLAAARGNP